MFTKWRLNKWWKILISQMWTKDHKTQFIQVRAVWFRKKNYWTLDSEIPLLTLDFSLCRSFDFSSTKGLGRELGHSCKVLSNSKESG